MANRKLTEAERKNRELRPRKRGEGSIYWNVKKQRFIALIVDSKPGAKIHRTPLSGKTAHEIEEKVARFKSTLVKGRRETKNLTLTKWMNQWLDTAGHKPATRQTYRSQISQYVTPSIGGKRLSEIEPDDVLELHAFMRRIKKANGEPLSPTTMFHTHKACSTAMSLAVKQRRIPYNPFLTVNAPDRAVSKRRSFTKAEKTRFLKTIEGREDESRWLAALMTGIRQGEAIGLRWKAVHLNSDIPYLEVIWQMTRPIWVCNCKTVCKKPHGINCPTKTLDLNRGSDFEIIQDSFVLTPPKTENGKRLIPIPDQMMEPMRRQYALYLEQRKTAGFRDHGFVWGRPNGHPMPHGNDNALWHTLCNAAGIESRTLHEARNTAATDMLDSNVDPALQKAIMGHSKYATTKTYQTVRLEMLAEAMAKTHGKSTN